MKSVTARRFRLAEAELPADIRKSELKASGRYRGVVLDWGDAEIRRSSTVQVLAILTNCKYTWLMILEILKHPDYVRILLALRRKPLRFTEIQRALELNPAQVDRALGFLRKGLWIVASTSPASRGKINAQYALGKKGFAFLESFESFRVGAKRRTNQIGKSGIAELQSLSR